MSNDAETAVHGYSMGITTKTEVQVADWLTLGHHVGHSNSDQQAQFLDGLAGAFEDMPPGARYRQMQFIQESGTLTDQRREEIAVVLENLAEYLRAITEEAAPGTPV